MRPICSIWRTLTYAYCLLNSISSPPSSLYLSTPPPNTICTHELCVITWKKTKIVCNFSIERKTNPKMSWKMVIDSWCTICRFTQNRTTYPGHTCMYNCAHFTYGALCSCAMWTIDKYMWSIGGLAVGVSRKTRIFRQSAHLKWHTHQMYSECHMPAKKCGIGEAAQGMPPTTPRTKAK